RAMFASQLALLTGFTGLEVEEPVPLEAARVAPSRIEPPGALAAVSTRDLRERATRAHGRAYRDLVRGFSGDFASAPDLVVRPETEGQVRIALEWASDAGYALVPYGGGTSVVSGVELDDRDTWPAVVCLDLRKLDRVLELDPVSRAARIQAGA